MLKKIGLLMVLSFSISASPCDLQKILGAQQQQGVQQPIANCDLPVNGPNGSTLQVQMRAVLTSEVPVRRLGDTGPIDNTAKPVVKMGLQLTIPCPGCNQEGYLRSEAKYFDVLEGDFAKLNEIARTETQQEAAKLAQAKRDLVSQTWDKVNPSAPANNGLNTNAAAPNGMRNSPGHSTSQPGGFGRGYNPTNIPGAPKTQAPPAAKNQPAQQPPANNGRAPIPTLNQPVTPQQLQAPGMR